MNILRSEVLVAALRDRGYAVIDDALPPRLAAALQLTAVEQLEHHAHMAGVGRSRDHAVHHDIRGDYICWLANSEMASAEYLQVMEQLRQQLNEQLFLGLFSCEAHYACYPAGAFYRTHRDAFKGARSRILSAVYYLNRDWPESAGGELVLYNDEASMTLETVQPFFNRMVVFLSEEFPHEVLPATRARYSIAGWFRGSP